MDTFFEHGNSWNIFKSSHGTREQGIDDWRWTKKLKADNHAELGQGKEGGTAIRSREEDEKGVQQRRPIYTFRRKASNAGLM